MKQKAKVIIFVHLYNDFSGSPCVLKDAIESLDGTGVEPILFTSQHRGFLSDLAIKKQTVPYLYSNKALIKLLFYVFSQFYLFFFLSFCLLKIRISGKHVEVVANTILPAAAVLAGKLFAHRTVSYVHELAVQSKLLSFFLKNIALKCSDRRIYVSQFLKESYFDEQGDVLLNGLRGDLSEYVAKLSYQELIECKLSHFRVLFVGNLREYKGFWAFLKLARLRPNMCFEAVINASESEFDAFRKTADIPINVNVVLRPKDLAESYQKAFVLLNLSDTRFVKETFGMTILEGFAFACPAIVPSEGGHHDFCSTNNSLSADVLAIEDVLTHLDSLSLNQGKWLELSKGAFETAQKLTNLEYKKRIKRYLLGF